MSPLGELKEKENDRETLDLRVKYQSAGGVSSTSHLTEPPPNEKQKHLSVTQKLYSTLELALYVWSLSRLLFLSNDSLSPTHCVLSKNDCGQQ